MDLKTSQLISQLDDEQAINRVYAIEDLAELGELICVRPISKKLTDEDIAVKEAAIDALIKLRFPQTIDYIFQHLFSEEVYIRNAVCEIIELQGDSGFMHFSKMCRAFIPANNNLSIKQIDVLKFIIDILGKMKLEKADNLQERISLLNLYRDVLDENIQIAIVESLSYLGEHQLLKEYEENFQAYTPWVQCAIIELASKAPSERQEQFKLNCYPKIIDDMVKTIFESKLSHLGAA